MLVSYGVVSLPHWAFERIGIQHDVTDDKGLKSSINGRRVTKNGNCQQFVEERHQINNNRGSHSSLNPDADNKPQAKALTPSPTNALNKTVNIIASFPFLQNRPRNAEQSPESAKTLEIDVRLAKKSSKQNYQIPSSIDCRNPVFSSASFGSRPRHLTGDRGRASLSTPREPSAEGDKGRIYRRNRHWDELSEAWALGSSCGKAPEQARAATMEMTLLFGLP